MKIVGGGRMDVYLCVLEWFSGVHGKEISMPSKSKGETTSLCVHIFLLHLMSLTVSSR